MAAAQRGVPVTWGRSQISLVIREAVARAVLNLVRPWGWFGGGHHRGPGDKTTPVILVSDHRWNRSVFAFLSTFLRRRGWASIWVVSAKRGARLKEQADKLQLTVLQVVRTTGATQVDVVGHGTGGLIAAWYVRHAQSDGLVRRLITLGTPWGGTRMAVFGRGPIARETLYGAHNLDALAEQPVPVVAIWSPEDPVVVPCESALPAGAESIRIEGAGNLEMLLSPRVFRAVQAALSHPIAANPA